MDQIEQLKALRDEALARIEAAKRAIEEGADGKMVASLEVIIGELEMSKEAHAAKQLVSENSPSSYQGIPWSDDEGGDGTDQVADAALGESLPDDPDPGVLADECLMSGEEGGYAGEEIVPEMEEGTGPQVEEVTEMEVQSFDENQSGAAEDETAPVSDTDVPEPVESWEDSESGVESTLPDEWIEDPKLSEDVAGDPGEEPEPGVTGAEERDAIEAEYPEHAFAVEETVLLGNGELEEATAEMIGPTGDDGQPGDTDFEVGEVTEPAFEEWELAPGEPVPLVEEIGGGDGVPFDCDQFALETQVEEINEPVSATDHHDGEGVADGEVEAIDNDEGERPDVSAVETPGSVDSSDQSGTEFRDEETESVGEATDSPEPPIDPDSQNLPKFPDDSGETEVIEDRAVASFSATVTEVNAPELDHPPDPSGEDPTRLVGVVPLRSIQGYAPPEPVEVSPGELAGEVLLEEPVIDPAPESGGQ